MLGLQSMAWTMLVQCGSGHYRRLTWCMWHMSRHWTLGSRREAYQSRALSKYTSLFGIINERKDSREYRGTMKINLTIYRCTAISTLSFTI